MKGVELLDDPRADPQAVRAELRDIETLNTLFGGTRAVVQSMLMMLEDGATHVGVATDHIIESFRNELWPGYKTGEGVDVPSKRVLHFKVGKALKDALNPQ